MDFKLRKPYKTLLFCLLFISSSSISFSQKKETRKDWIQDYKCAVIKYGIFHGLNNFALATQLQRAENSFYAPFFQVLHKKAIERGGVFLVDMIRKDSVDRDERVAEGATGKRVLLLSAQFYCSHTLNKMAKKEYRIWRRVPNQKELKENINIAY